MSCGQTSDPAPPPFQTTLFFIKPFSERNVSLRVSQLTLGRIEKRRRTIFLKSKHEITPIFQFRGIPTIWYYFAVYSSSVRLSWFVKLQRLALPRIEPRTLWLPVGCSTIELIIILYTVDSFMPGFLNASHLFSVLSVQLSWSWQLSIHRW